MSPTLSRQSRPLPEVSTDARPQQSRPQGGLFTDSGAILRASWCGQSSALLRPDIYDPTVNPLYRHLLAH
jgi:hypothetical protein